MYETFEKNEIYLQYSAGSVPALQRHARSAWIHGLSAVIMFATVIWRGGCIGNIGTSATGMATTVPPIRNAIHKNWSRRLHQGFADVACAFASFD